jgi:predicted signal transduction protein with EAL and GGDEF domain
LLATKGGFIRTRAIKGIPRRVDHPTALSGGGRRPELVKALVGLGRTLGLIVVAEGVEDAAQLEYLRAVDCDRAQGYHFARPLSAEQVEVFLGREVSRAGARTGERGMASAP